MPSRVRAPSKGRQVDAWVALSAVMLLAIPSSGAAQVHQSEFVVIRSADAIEPSERLRANVAARDGLLRVDGDPAAVVRYRGLTAEQQESLALAGQGSSLRPSHRSAR